MKWVLIFVVMLNAEMAPVVEVETFTNEKACLEDLNEYHIGAAHEYIEKGGKLLHFTGQCYPVDSI